MGIFDFLKVGQIKAENEELKKKVDELTALSNNLANKLTISENKFDSLNKSYNDLFATVNGEKITSTSSERSDCSERKT